MLKSAVLGVCLAIMLVVSAAPFLRQLFAALGQVAPLLTGS